MLDPLRRIARLLTIPVPGVTPPGRPRKDTIIVQYRLLVPSSLMQGRNVKKTATGFTSFVTVAETDTHAITVPAAEAIASVYRRCYLSDPRSRHILMGWTRVGETVVGSRFIPEAKHTAEHMRVAVVSEGAPLGGCPECIMVEADLINAHETPTERARRDESRERR